MKVIVGNQFNVYVYPEDHAPPHCHIRYTDNKTESVLGIPLLNHIAGRPVDKGIKDELSKHLKKLLEAWEILNPQSDKKNDH